LQQDGQWFAEDNDTALTKATLQEYLSERQEGAQVRLQADAGVTMTTLRKRLETLQGLGVEQVRLVTRNDGGGQ